MVEGHQRGGSGLRSSDFRIEGLGFRDEGDVRDIWGYIGIHRDSR